MTFPGRFPDEPEPRAGWFMAVLRFAITHLIPVGVTVALNLVMRAGVLTLLPLNIVIERAYGNYALLLGMAGALVGSAAFSRDEAPFSISAFVAAALAALIFGTPFIVGRAGLTLGLPPRYFDILAIYAYLGFFLVIGLLVAGCWSVVVRAVREARARG